MVTRIRNVTRGESYHFHGADYSAVVDAWCRVGKDWRRLCALCAVWGFLVGWQGPGEAAPGAG